MKTRKSMRKSCLFQKGRSPLMRPITIKTLLLSSWELQGLFNLKESGKYLIKLGDLHQGKQLYATT